MEPFLLGGGGGHQRTWLTLLWVLMERGIQSLKSLLLHMVQRLPDCTIPLVQSACILASGCWSHSEQPEWRIHQQPEGTARRDQLRELTTFLSRTICPRVLSHAVYFLPCMSCLVPLDGMDAAARQSLLLHQLRPAGVRSWAG